MSGWWRRRPGIEFCLPPLAAAPEADLLARRRAGALPQAAP